MQPKTWQWPAASLQQQQGATPLKTVTDGEWKLLRLSEALVMHASGLVTYFWGSGDRHWHGELPDFLVDRSWHAHTLEDAQPATSAFAVLEQRLLEKLDHVVGALRDCDTEAHAKGWRIALPSSYPT